VHAHARPHPCLSIEATVGVALLGETAGRCLASSPYCSHSFIAGMESASRWLTLLVCAVLLPYIHPAGLVVLVLAGAHCWCAVLLPLRIQRIPHYWHSWTPSVGQCCPTCHAGRGTRSSTAGVAASYYTRSYVVLM
jgi:hypothetical protein